MVKYIENNFKIISLYESLYNDRFDIDEIKEKINKGIFKNYHTADLYRFRIFLDSCLLMFNKEKMEKYHFKNKFEYDGFMEKLLNDINYRELSRNLEKVIDNEVNLKINIFSNKTFYFSVNESIVNIYDSITRLRHAFAHMQYGNFAIQPTGIISFYGIFNKDKGKLKNVGLIIEPLAHKFIEAFFMNQMIKGIPYKHSFIDTEIINYKRKVFFYEITYKGNSLYHGFGNHIMKDRIFSSRNSRDIINFIELNKDEFNLKRNLLSDGEIENFEKFIQRELGRKDKDLELGYAIKAFYDFETEFSNFLCHLIQLNDRMIEYRFIENKQQRDSIMESIDELREDKDSWILFKIFFDILFMINIVIRLEDDDLSAINVEEINVDKFVRNSYDEVKYINRNIINGKIKIGNERYGDVYYVLERLRNSIVHGKINILLKDKKILFQFLDFYNSRKEKIVIERDAFRDFIRCNNWKYNG